MTKKATEKYFSGFFKTFLPKCGYDINSLDMSKRNSQFQRLTIDTPKDKLSFIWPISLIIALIALTYFLGPDNYSFWLAQ